MIIFEFFVAWIGGVAFGLLIRRRFEQFRHWLETDDYDPYA